MKPMDVAGDVQLYVLDDEGILFAESRQELHSANTAATLIWCLLEDALPLDRLVDTYASSFGLARSDAEHHVYPILRRWFALGYVSAPDVPGPQETPLTTALAFLLTNEDLRRRFRGSPQATARALGVQAEDLDTFLALDPDALERQADDIAEHRGRQRFASPSGTFPLDAPDLLEKATNGRGSPRRLTAVIDSSAPHSR